MEEVRILNEEMQRILESHVYKAKWWGICWEGYGRDWASGDHVKGAQAYADKQAAMYVALAGNCRHVWAKYGWGQVTPSVALEGDASSSDNDLDSDGIVGEFEDLLV